MIAQGWDCTEVKGRKGAERRVEGEGKMDEDNTHWIMTPASRRRMWSKNSPLVYMSEYYSWLVAYRTVKCGRGRTTLSHAPPEL